MLTTGGDLEFNFQAHGRLLCRGDERKQRSSRMLCGVFIALVRSPYSCHTTSVADSVVANIECKGRKQEFAPPSIEL